MKIAMLYEDKEIFVSLSPEEFIDLCGQYVDKNDLKKGIDESIKRLKKKTLTA